MDPELLSDKSQLVECLTKAGLVVKVKEEKNLIKEDQDDNEVAESFITSSESRRRGKEQVGGYG